MADLGRTGEPRRSQGTWNGRPRPLLAQIFAELSSWQVRHDRRLSLLHPLGGGSQRTVAAGCTRRVPSATNGNRHSIGQQSLSKREDPHRQPLHCGHLIDSVWTANRDLSECGRCALPAAVPPTVAGHKAQVEGKERVRPLVGGEIHKRQASSGPKTSHLSPFASSLRKMKF